MELGEKIRELRKQKILHRKNWQEYYSYPRTAVSKWESGRGYPNMESLKAISKFFGISLDNLISQRQ